MIIGVTGIIASGKTFVSRIMSGLGAKVFNADDCVRNLMNEGNIGFVKVKKAFPEAFVNDGFDKDKLAEIVFADYNKLKILEVILHPLVRKQMQDFIAKNTGFIIVLDVPLLFESGLDKLCDKVIAVSCSTKTQIERIIRRKIPLKRLEQINKRQFSNAQKCQNADFIIQNDYNQDNLKKQVDEIWLKINA